MFRFYFHPIFCPPPICEIPILLYHKRLFPNLLYHKTSYFRFHRCQNRGFAAVLAAICERATAPSAPSRASVWRRRLRRRRTRPAFPTNASRIFSSAPRFSLRQTCYAQRAMLHTRRFTRVDKQAVLYVPSSGHGAPCAAFNALRSTTCCSMRCASRAALHVLCSTRCAPLALFLT